MAYGFANILLAGACNLRCPYCIGNELPRRASNLDDFPLRGLARFVARLRSERIRQISLTGTDTEPLLYRHPQALVAYLRREVPGALLSLHTNGMLATAKVQVVHLFDRVCVSVPSFSAETFARMTGSRLTLDLAALTRVVNIPLKISTTVTDDNVDEVEEIIQRCAALGVKRMALRRLFSPSSAPPKRLPILETHTSVRRFGGNPVYRLYGVEVTVWDFDTGDLRCLNLFADGTVSDDYLLAAAPASLKRRRDDEHDAAALLSIGGA
jgi:MoaA/NifB/PqqE/SkfB family radical SAM enzyme